MYMETSNEILANWSFGILGVKRQNDKFKHEAEKINIIKSFYARNFRI